MADEDLDRRATIAQLATIVTQAESDLREGFALIRKAEKSLDTAFSSDRWHSISVPNRYVNYGKPEDSIQELTRILWRALIERLEVKRFMSPPAIRKLDEMVMREEVVPITEESMIALVEQYRGNLPDMLAESVEHVYRFLRPTSDLKTNSEFGVGKKVILERAVEWWTTSFHVKMRWQDDLRALENVFTALDGKGQISKTYNSHLCDAINQTGEHGKGETEYFEFRCYLKNGNLHLKFKRPDLVQRFNRMAGARLLPQKPSDQPSGSAA